MRRMMPLHDEAVGEAWKSQCDASKIMKMRSVRRMKTSEAIADGLIRSRELSGTLTHGNLENLENV